MESILFPDGETSHAKGGEPDQPKPSLELAARSHRQNDPM